MKKNKHYYYTKIRVIIEDSILETSSGLRANCSYDQYVERLMTCYLLYGIDYLLTILELDMRKGLYYISIRRWDKIVDIDYSLHHC